jgi:hypothetical protein
MNSELKEHSKFEERERKRVACCCCCLHSTRCWVRVHRDHTVNQRAGENRITIIFLYYALFWYAEIRLPNMRYVWLSDIWHCVERGFSLCGLADCMSGRHFFGWVQVNELYSLYVYVFALVNRRNRILFGSGRVTSFDCRFSTLMNGSLLPMDSM